MDKLRETAKKIGLAGLLGLGSMTLQGCIQDGKIQPLDYIIGFIPRGLEAGARMDRSNPYSSNYSGYVYGE